MYIILCFILLSCVSCASNRPIATVHTERIEERVKPVAVGADTIEIEFSSIVNGQHFLAKGSKTFGSTDNASNKRANARQDTARCFFPMVKFFSPFGNWNEFHCSHSSQKIPTRRSIASTRGVSVKTTHTDTTQTLRITLKPDTIFVPYVHHIRSDTIVAPDPTTKAKLTTARWQIVALILIIIIIIVYSLWSTVNR